MADGLPWYKHNGQDFISGTMGFSRALRGTYIVLIDSIYIEGGQVKDDREHFAGLLGCTFKEWAADRAKLIQKGKIGVVTIDGVQYLTNDRATREIVATRALARKRSKGGLASAKARGLSPKHLKLVED